MSRDLHIRPAMWIGCVAALALCFATPSLAQDTPFVGIVDEATAEVRAGAARNFYVVNRLQRGTLVQVEDMLSGWSMIQPPEGTHSIVSKAQVDAKGDGSTGVVNVDRAVVKAAGIDTQPDDWFRTQVNLRKGDTVQIVGEVESSTGSFYKIVSPKAAVVYLPPGAIRRATPEEIRAARQGAEPAPVAPQPEPVVEPTRPEPVVEQPAEPEPVIEVVEEETVQETQTVVETEPVIEEEVTEEAIEAVAEDATDEATEEATEQAPRGDEAVAQAAPDDGVPAAVAEAVRAVEAHLHEVKKQPLIEQPLDDLLQAYRLLQQDSQLVATDRFIVDTRIAQLERNKAVADILRRGSQLQQEMESRETIDVQELQRQEMLRAGYVAVGRLSASTVYNGQNLPRLYRLQDPADHRTIAYVRPGQHVDARLMGKLIGIYGQMRYDAALKLRVIEVQQVDVLEPQREAAE